AEPGPHRDPAAAAGCPVGPQRPLCQRQHPDRDHEAAAGKAGPPRGAENGAQFRLPIGGGRTMKVRSVIRLWALGAVWLVSAAAAAGALAFWHSRRQLALLDGFCTALVARAPETADAVYALAKEGGFAAGSTPGVLWALGYRPGDFAAGTGLLYAAAAL